MSEPWSETGRTENRRCPSCGSTAEYHEAKGTYGSGPRWFAQAHVAPCGLPCLHGGVKLAALRSGQVHGRWATPEMHYPGTEWFDPETVPARDAVPCPACGASGPVDPEAYAAAIAAGG